MSDEHAPTTEHVEPHAEGDEHAPTTEHVVEAAPPAPEAPPAPPAPKKPIEEWERLRAGDRKKGIPPHPTAWLHKAARVHKGWAEVGTMLTEAEYDAGLAAAGAVNLQ